MFAAWQVWQKMSVPGLGGVVGGSGDVVIGSGVVSIGTDVVSGLVVRGEI